MVRFAVFPVVAVSLAAVPAQAQFGTIFGDPPRPPADVPSRPPAGPGFPPQPPPVRGPAGIQQQPLPPPPGATAVDPPARAPAPAARARPAAPAPANQPPAAAQPLPPPANPPPPQPANTAPQPDDTVITEMPTQKIANERAVFSGLDKITGRIINFDAAINETVQFGALQVTPRVCYTRPPTEAANTDAFLEVDEVTLQGEIKRIFTGWMFASSPGLHAVEHPIYDVWLTDCKGPINPPVAAAQPAPTPSAAPPARPRAPRQPR